MEIKRILVSRTDKIGDLILSIPSFYMLKKRDVFRCHYKNKKILPVVGWRLGQIRIFCFLKYSTYTKPPEASYFFE